MANQRIEIVGDNIQLTGGLWYLAGPFFNVPQKLWAERIRDLVIGADRHYYAPVEHMFQEGIHDKSKATKVFNDNQENLIRANVVLCQLDWLLEDDSELRVIRMQQGTLKSVLSSKLNIPDAGTLWEMGYACALRNSRNSQLRITAQGPAVIGYVSQKTEKLNLMLARSCDGFYNGEDELIRFIFDGLIRQGDTFKGKEI